MLYYIKNVCLVVFVLEFSKDRACCFTGHRKISHEKLSSVLTRLQLEIGLMTERGVNHFITGGALGFDTLAALAVIGIKQQTEDAFLHLMLPCHDQCYHWTQRDIEVYNYIKSRADSFDYVAEHYHSGVMQLRNRAMVDASANCICYWDSSIANEKTGSGTLYTVNYARKSGIQIINLCDESEDNVQFAFNFTE